MRTLSRPMFNMGGPIKQGIMHGIREPKKDGKIVGGHQSPLLAGAHPIKDKSGREHHVLPVGAALYGLGQAALRFGPAAYRGWKASRAFTPWSKNLGWAKRARDILLPKKSLRLRPQETGLSGVSEPMLAGEGAGFGFGSFARTNPGTTFLLGSSVPQAGTLGYKVGKEGVQSIPGALKRYADMVIPGDQSRWWKDKEPPTGVPLNPNLQKLISAVDAPAKEPKKLSEAERKAFANKQREERVQKYLDLMGYDRSKKTAIADALIDASKIVGDRGSLDPKNITQELINPIIQATSKRLDKPDQIREAVGLMATKAEIEKDLSAETDALDKEYKRTQIAVGQKSLERGFEKDMADFFLGSRTKPDKKQTETYARIKADEYGLPFTKVTNEEIAKAPEGASETEIIQSVVGDDGIYMVGNAMIKVTGGVPKVLIGA